LKIRIGFLLDRMEIGGAERLLALLAPALRSGGIEPIFLCLYQAGAVGEQLRNEGFQVVSFNLKNRLDLFGYRRLTHWLKQEHLHGLYTYDGPMLMFWAAVAKRRGWIRHYWIGFHTTQRLDRFFRRLFAERFSLAGADSIVVLSEHHRNVLLARYHLPTGRFTIIPNGIDTSHFRPPADSATCKQALGLPADSLTVSLIARIRPEKRHDLFLEAARLVHPQMPQTRFLIAGSGPLEEKYKDFVRQHDMQDYTLFLGLRDDISLIWGATDVGLLCSDTETLPVSLLEAGACGVPVVGTDVEGIRQVIQQRVNGLLVPHNDPQALAQAIVQLLQNPQQRAEMGKAACQFVERNFSFQKMIRDYLELFETSSTRERESQGEEGRRG
jgi:glycosyltransferase involved in cell wall biosynthesis